MFTQENIKAYLISALQTFATSFLVILGTTLSAGNIQWTSAFWFGILLTVARGALKEVFARFAPLSLGGRQGKTLFGFRK